MSSKARQKVPLGPVAVVEGLGQPAELRPWRANAYRLQKGAVGSIDFIEAVPGTEWRREDPFASYKPASRAKELEAGPHVVFMRLERQREARSEKGQDFFDTALNLFSNEYGLLGLFYERFSAPILPEDKAFVAPNAMIDGSGRLHRVDPEAEGKRLLEDLLDQRDSSPKQPGQKVRFGSSLAMPRDLEFGAKNILTAFGHSDPQGEALHPEMVPWEELKEDYGCFVVLDEHAGPGVSVLSTREPIFWWERELDSFPLGEDLTAQKGFALGKINPRIADVSPHAYRGTDGQPEPGWRCPSLLMAMYMMLYLDMTGGRSIRRCQRSGCWNYYRMGTQESMYCSDKCTSLASTRRYLGQEL